MGMGDQKKGFVATTYEMLNAGYEEIAWSEDGKSILVRNPERFGAKILPIHFGHSQFASWVRAANANDFKKTGRGEWMHPNFQRDRPELLSSIQRKKAKPRPKPLPPTAAPPKPAEAPDGEPSWPLEELTQELEMILEEEREGLDFLRAEVARLEEDKAQLEKERVSDMAVAQKLLGVAQFLMSETRALKPLEGPTATEIGVEYKCPLGLPGLRMIGTNPLRDDDFKCTHALVARHPRAIELANTPEFTSKISELREQYEEFRKAYPEHELSTERFEALLGSKEEAMEGVDGR